MQTLQENPVRLALVGTGNRSRKIYQPLWEGLKPWIQLVAVCDPVKESADQYAEALGVKAYYDLREMAKDPDIEAAVVVAPIEMHHAASVYLSEHHIHNLIETTWCSTLFQARDMIQKAKDNHVYTRVAENFFRYPIDRFAQLLRDDGYIGDIRRIFTYNDHTGYHSNSRWIVFAKEYPEWVQAVYHDMPTMPFYETPVRFHDHELFRAHFFQFPSGLMVFDSAANIKGLLGRQVRPGFTEWHGTKGTLVQQGGRYSAPTHYFHDNNNRTEVGTGVHPDWEAELRCSVYDDSKILDDKIRPGFPNHISKVERYYNAYGGWAGVKAETPLGVLDYQNPIQPEHYGDHYFPEYGICVMGHLIDFALQIRGVKDSEFNEQDALMSEMMAVGARESALQEGRRVHLPLEGDLEADKLELARLKEKYGVDPLDIEAMMSISYTKP